MPATRADIDDFVSQRAIAIVGVSRNGRKFGNAAYRELKAKGVRVVAVHPELDRIEGDPVARDFASLPHPVGGVLVVVRPERTESVVREAARAGIRRVWMQQGAESPAAIRFCEENGIRAVHGHCVLMFAEPVSFLHRFHRSILRLLGRLPR